MLPASSSPFIIPYTLIGVSTFLFLMKVVLPPGVLVEVGVPVSVLKANASAFLKCLPRYVLPI